jgi:uncharacterized protein (TIGR03435 family)
MPQLIANAYDIDPANVSGGPVWLDMDRFDIVAKAPPGTPAATLRLMMQSVLKDRFHLVVHSGTAPMPAYVLSVEKGKLKLTESAESGDPHCEYKPPSDNEPPATIPQIVFACHNETMADFARNLHNLAGGYLDKPVVDSTGLKAAYDFDFKWTPQPLLAKAGADGISLFDAVDKELGLKLALETAPRPVLIVDSADETPTPNLPGLEKALPPLPPAQFEVATIKPSKPDERGRFGFQGDQLNVQGITLKDLITFVWDVNPLDSEDLVGAPAWLDKDKFDMLGKIASDDSGKPPPVDFDVLKQLLRGLIADRFQMKSHTEERPVSAYTLTSVSPKMKPAADPKSRMKCTEGTGPDGKDPRKANAALDRLLWCQNMTMKVFSEQLQYLANGYIYYPVVDGTGLKGGWDFALNFSSIGQTMPGGGNTGGGSGASQAGGAPTASDPNGAVTLFDAVRNQLGLKLEKEKRTEPVLVIDHIEEQPTEN